METAESIPAGAKAACDALCTVLGVKVPLRLIPQPPTMKPHIVIKRDISKDDELNGAETERARFTFVANKRINVNKGAVLLFGIEHPTPEGASKSTVANLETFLLEADLFGTADEEDDAPKVSKKAASEVKRARSEARKNMVALPPKMRKSLGQKLPNMYYAAAHELGQIPAIPSSELSDAYIPRVFATAAVQTDDLIVPPPSPPPILIAPRAPSCSLDDLRKSPVQLPSPVSADHAREMTPNASLAPLEDEMAYRYEVERSLSPMDLESDNSSPDASPASLQVALPEGNEAPTPQLLPEARLVSVTIADDALPPPTEELDPPSIVAVSSDLTSANILETPPQRLAGAQARSVSPPRPDTPELHAVEMSEPMEGVIESLPEVEVKREQIQATESLALVDDNPKSINSVPAISDATPARGAKEIPSEPRAMRKAASPTWVAGGAATTFVTSTQASTWDQTAAPYVPAPTLYNPLGIRPAANAPVFHRAPPTGPRSLMGASSSSGAPKKPVVVGAKWTASRGPAQPGALNATLSSSSSTASTSSSAQTSVSSQPTSPAISSSNSPPPVRKANRDLAVIAEYSSPSPPPVLITPPPKCEAAPQSPLAPETKAAPPRTPPAASAAPPAEAPAASKWKRINNADGGMSHSTATSALPFTSATTPPLPVVQSVSITLPTASSSTTPSASAATPPLPAVQPVANPPHTSTSILPSSSAVPPSATAARPVTTPLRASISTSTLPSAGAVTLPPVPTVRPATIPLPSKPASVSVITLPHRPASVLAVPASFRDPVRTVPPSSTSNTSNTSNPPNTFNPSNTSNSCTSAATASPPNPRKRPHESSVKTVEVKLSSSPAVSSIPLGPVKMEMTPPPECASRAASSLALSSASASAVGMGVAGSSRTTAHMTPASFLKAHVPQPALSQMAIDAVSTSRCSSVTGDPTNLTDATDTTATTSTTTKKKKRRQKRGQKWTGNIEDGQVLAKDPGAAPGWPTTVPKLKHRLVPNVTPPPGASAVPGVKKIMVSKDGARLAILCEDHTLRIWLNESAGVAPGEIARLNHKQSLVTACWMDMHRIMVLTRDGAVLLWTRSVSGKEEWNPLRLFTLPEMGPDDAPYCLAYAPDRIAVSVPSGVKIWLYNEGKWQQQRDIIRGGVTAIKFVYDGAGLIGGCRDGVIWYCEVPNGTLRAYAFIPQERRAIESIDINTSGLRMLVTQTGGRAYLISLNANENRGTIERTYTSEKFHNSPTPMFPGVFAMRGQTVLYGYMHDCVPIWNRKKGSIVYGLKHNKGDVVQAAATFDDPSGVGGSMITGTSKGELFWWPPPEVHQSTSHGDIPDDVSRKRQRVG